MKLVLAPDLLNLSPLDADLGQSVPDRSRIDGLIELVFDEATAGEVDAQPEPAVDEVGDDPDRNEGNGENVGPATDRHERHMGLANDLEHRFSHFSPRRQLAFRWTGFARYAGP
ncbi:MAG: hypothetical protein R3E12_01310 [Candidatus Eisenbacteria bacterium]